MHDTPKHPLTSTAHDTVAMAVDSPRVESWNPHLAVATASVATSIVARSFPTGWQAAVLRPPQLKLFSVQFTGRVASAVSLPVTATKLKVSSFQFPQLGGWRKNTATCESLPAGDAPGNVPPQASDASSMAASAAEPAGQPPGRTRIKPPGDVIKLEDRLFYVLQPSLETLIGEGSLAFPFHPFPYQFEGVAFLYPRHAAILADEMGLGKTMQAITAMRLLLHARRSCAACCWSAPSRW